MLHFIICEIDHVWNVVPVSFEENRFVLMSAFSGIFVECFKSRFDQFEELAEG